MKAFFCAMMARVFISGHGPSSTTRCLGVTMSDGANGVTVSGVAANSPAARMGIQVGDRLLAINSNATANSGDVIRMIGGMQAGTRVELTMARGGWQGRLSGALGAAGSVFNSGMQVQEISSPVNLTPDNTAQWGFPYNLFDNGSRGVVAAYGGGGY